VVVVKNQRLNQDIRTEITVGDFFRGIGGCDHLLTMRAVVTMLLEKGDFRTGGDEVFLGVLDHFLRSAQPVVTIGTMIEGLRHHPVDSLGLHSRAAHVSNLLAGNLRTPHPLSEPQGFQEFLLGLFLFLLPEFSFKLPDTLLFLQDDFNEFFFGLLRKEELAVFSHNLKNGQAGDFFEGITSGG